MQSRHLAAGGNFVPIRVFLDTARVASFELCFYVRTALLVSKLGKTGRDEQKSFPLTDYENMTVDDAVNFALYLQQCLNGKRHLAYLPAAGFHAHSKDVVEQATEISTRFGGRLLAKLKHEMKPSVFGRSTGSPFFLAIDADPEASLQHALDVDIANAEKIGHALERLAIVEGTLGLAHPPFQVCSGEAGLWGFLWYGCEDVGQDGRSDRVDYRPLQRVCHRGVRITTS